MADTIEKHASDPRFPLLASLLLGATWISLAWVNPNYGRPSTAVIGYFLGVQYAHVTLSASWATLGPGNLRMRLILSVCWLIALPIPVVITVGVAGMGGTLWALVACLYGQWIVVQALLIPVAWRTGLRIESSAGRDGLGQGDPYQFGIRDLLIFMAISAILLAGWRALLKLLTFYSSDEPAFIFLAIAAVYFTVPLILATLLNRRAIIGVSASLFLIASGTALELPMMEEYFHVSGPNFGHMVAINLTSTLVISVAMLSVRMSGYGLRIVKPLAGKAVDSYVLSDGESGSNAS